MAIRLWEVVAGPTFPLTLGDVHHTHEMVFRALYKTTNWRSETIGGTDGVDGYLEIEEIT